MDVGPRKKIVVAPLNWGLGHATRCIPLVNALLEANFIPILASDGAALTLLRKEFPSLDYVTLPSYGIKYAKNNRLKWQLFKAIPHCLKAVKKEKEQLAELCKHHDIHGIISDNRFGMFHKDIPSVYISHQLRVLSGATTWLSTYIHQRIIKKFDACWVPDLPTQALSGKMSSSRLTVTYLGVLSRLKKTKSPIKVDILIVLSGPEPQRSILEKRLLRLFSATQQRVVLIRGIFSEQPLPPGPSTLKVVNYALKDELEQLMNASEVIISRSGYSTILDLAKLNKKAFFIPTPGQYEQIYLAKRLHQKGIAPFATQDAFSLAHLRELPKYTGFTQELEEGLPPGLFKLF